VRTNRTLAAGVLVAAVVLLVASIAFAATRDGDHGRMMRFGPGMMGYATDTGGRVGDRAAARERAQAFADRLDLRVGEVMQFQRNYYAELLADDGDRATEVLVAPSTGAVWIEYGPAMMWNTRYGMMVDARWRDHRKMGGRAMMGDAMMGEGVSPIGGATPAEARDGTVTASEAVRIADRWLADAQPGARAGEAEAFPGYFTLHVLRGEKVTGMLSVNATSGVVWFHWWHGAFVGMDE
jgi:hypothetical protein